MILSNSELSVVKKALEHCYTSSEQTGMSEDELREAEIIATMIRNHLRAPYPDLRSPRQRGRF